jgi:hypothetical protein
MTTTNPTRSQITAVIDDIWTTLDTLVDWDLDDSLLHAAYENLRKAVNYLEEYEDQEGDQEEFELEPEPE